MKKKIRREKRIIGAVERCDLPEFGIHGLEVRIDTGAKTSSLHVDNIQVTDTPENEPRVSFDIHPDVYNIDETVTCECPLISTRSVKSSNGTAENRYLIQTEIKLGDDVWPIRITLTDRADMTYRMLLGRQAMFSRVLVDPSRKFLAGNKT